MQVSLHLGLDALGVDDINTGDTFINDNGTLFARIYKNNS